MKKLSKPPIIEKNQTHKIDLKKEVNSLSLISSHFDIATEQAIKFKDLYKRCVMTASNKVDEKFLEPFRSEINFESHGSYFNRAESNEISSHFEKFCFIIAELKGITPTQFKEFLKDLEKEKDGLKNLQF